MPIRNYPAWKRASDWVYGALTQGQWPGRLAWTVNPRADVGVEEHRILVRAGLPAGASLRIGYASDFHAGPATPWPLIEAAVEQLDRLRADVLLLGGDFVSIDPRRAGRLGHLLGTVHAPLGRFAVLGNHDHWAGASTVVAHLQNAGIEMLTNRAIGLPHPFDNVSVCGLDDHMSGEPDAERAFADAREVRVVLMHAPSGLLDVGENPFDVALCGHTHGGQIALPDGRPIVVASGALSGRYNAGRYSLGLHRTLLVSRGVGCGTLPIRWNSPSTVSLCCLSSDPKAGQHLSSPHSSRRAPQSTRDSVSHRDRRGSEPGK
ncbi:MAG: metallophosphoesterase [Rhizobacter sp.]